MTATTLSGSLVSVGYEGLSADELVATLVDQGVSVLVDVRLTPLSRKPGLSKTRLSEAVRGVGIEYVHLPGLGNPKENRDAFRRGEPESWEAFAQVLGSQRGQSALAHVAELLDGGTVRVAVPRAGPHEMPPVGGHRPHCQRPDRASASPISKRLSKQRAL